MGQYELLDHMRKINAWKTGKELGEAADHPNVFILLRKLHRAGFIEKKVVAIDKKTGEYCAILPGVTIVKTTTLYRVKR